MSRRKRPNDDRYDPLDPSTFRTLKKRKKCFSKQEMALFYRDWSLSPSLRDIERKKTERMHLFQQYYAITATFSLQQQQRLENHTKPESEISLLCDEKSLSQHSENESSSVVVTGTGSSSNHNCEAKNTSSQQQLQSKSPTNTVKITYQCSCIVPEDTFFAILSYLNIRFIDNVILYVSPVIAQKLSHMVRNGAFFRLRERPCFDVIWKNDPDSVEEMGTSSAASGTDSTSCQDSTAPVSLAEIERGYPQIFKDMAWIWSNCRSDEIASEKKVHFPQLWRQSLYDFEERFLHPLMDYNFHSFVVDICEDSVLPSDVLASSDHDMMLRHYTSDFTDYLAPCLLDSKSFIFALSRHHDEDALFYASERLKRCPEFVLKLVRDVPKAYVHCEYPASECREAALIAVSAEWKHLASVPLCLRSDKEIMNVAIHSNALAAGFLPLSFRSNKPFMLQQIKRNGSVLRFASPELQNDREVVLAAVEQCPAVIRFAAESFQTDHNFVRPLIRDRKSPGAYTVLPQKMKEDKELALLALRPYIDIDLHLSVPTSLTNDEEFMRAAIRMNPENYAHASKTVKQDRDLLLHIIREQNFPDALRYAPESLRDDKEVIELATGVDPRCLLLASFRLISNWKHELESTRWPSEASRKDKSHVESVVLRGPIHIREASQEILSDRDFIFELAKKAPGILKFVEPSILDREFFEQLLKHNIFSMTKLPEHLSTDKDFILGLSVQYGGMLSLASDPVLYQTVDDACKMNPLCVSYCRNASMLCYDDALECLQQMGTFGCIPHSHLVSGYFRKEFYWHAYLYCDDLLEHLEQIATPLCLLEMLYQNPRQINFLLRMEWLPVHDTEFLSKMIQQDPYCLDHIERETVEDMLSKPELVEALFIYFRQLVSLMETARIVKQDQDLYTFHRDAAYLFLRWAVKRSPQILEMVPRMILLDGKLFQNLVSCNSECLKYAPEEYCGDNDDDAIPLAVSS